MKRIKDPIYGYIEIDDDVCLSIVDTAEFQRLRRIVQTSYSPLYPSAFHNRFVHSLGVYYLGRIAADALTECVQKMFGESSEELRYWEGARSTFELACLLHDFGHSPFSHSGEEFFEQYNDLDRDLSDAVGDERFAEDVSNRRRASRSAAPHEMMSAILAINRFGDIIDDKALFARAITGYTITECQNASDYLSNILIQVLNSQTIDVDRLDYLIRDAYVVGFESTSIDYRRLLQSLRIVVRKDIDGKKYALAYHKAAVSVIENAVFARDFEKKWVQSHPAVLYDQFLVQHAIRKVNSSCCVTSLNNDKNEETVTPVLFTREALTIEGVIFDGGQRVRLACDDDIIYVAKNSYANEDLLVKEYFSRADRRHPLWKSEAEFKSIFGFGAKDGTESMQKRMGEIEDAIRKSGRDLLLNDDLIDALKDELNSSCGKSDSIARRRSTLEKNIAFLHGLKSITEAKGFSFDYVLLGTRGFISGFDNASLGRTLITFSEDSRGEHTLDDVTSLLTASPSVGSVFYLYHKEARDPRFPKQAIVDLLLGRSDSE